MPVAAALPAPSQRAVLEDMSQVGEARRLAGAAARAAGLDDVAAGRLAVVVTEAASNVVRHGGGGEMLLRVLDTGDARGVEVLAIDRGPGIADVARALQDGHSTGGTPGTGLGAIRRLATVFDLHTAAGVGTIVLAQVWTRPPPAPVHGAVCLPKRGESECGDVWALQHLGGGGWRALVADGLGHGPDAHEAARKVAEGVTASPTGAAQAMVNAHLAARPTRGAAAAVVELEAAREVRFSGVGNVAAVLLGDGSTHSMVSINGTLGQGVVRPREFTYSVPAGGLMVLASDGLASRWSLDAYPGLQARHPALVAGVLYRDHSRQRDDVTVVAVRLEEAR
jgi:anti-sigma regulatory factor (Ser/Thr protein kinase)